MSDTPRADAIAHHGYQLDALATKAIYLCRELERENAALRKDKERLDFINANHLVRFGHSAKMGGHGPGWYWVLGEVASHYRIKNIRDTIDSAIAWYKKPRGPKQNIHIQETQP